MIWNWFLSNKHFKTFFNLYFKKNKKLGRVTGFFLSPHPLLPTHPPEIEHGCPSFLIEIYQMFTDYGELKKTDISGPDHNKNTGTSAA